jgi:hypothetical protein
MRALSAAAVALLTLAACAQPRDSVPITVTHEGRAKASQSELADTRSRDRTGSAATGGTATGGMHAPGTQ